MSRLIVLTGVPGVGKSTLVDAMIKNMNTPYVYSTDDELAKIAAQANSTYDEVFLHHFWDAKATAESGLREALKRKQDVIWDQTNLTPKKRKSILDRFPKTYVREAIAIRPPVKSADYVIYDLRLEGRPGKTIPPGVVADMIKTYTDPKPEEGFASVTIYNFGEV